MAFLDAYQVKGQFPKRHLTQGKASDFMVLEN